VLWQLVVVEMEQVQMLEKELVVAVDLDIKIIFLLLLDNLIQYKLEILEVLLVMDKLYLVEIHIL
tara:strand:+ start:194 stop:388 length:195 start_codon:yes stop_codon:yes gene_type:complete